MQIGPRLRVGGTLGKVGQKVKIGVGKAAQPIGKVVSIFNPGLGTAISTAGDVLDTTDGKFNFGKAAKNAAIQYGVGKVANSVLGKLRGTPDLSGIDQAKDYVSGINVGSGGVSQAGHVLSMGDRFRSLGDVGSFLSKHKNDILDYGQAAEDIYGKYRQTQAQDEAMKLAKQRYAENAPLRARGRELLLDESRPDLSAVFADPNNPQGRYRVVNVGSR